MDRAKLGRLAARPGAKRQAVARGGLVRVLELVPLEVDRFAEHVSGAGRFAGYQLQGLWFRRDSYVYLRNAAWALRNSRVGNVYNPAALSVVLDAAQKLVSSGEELRDVLEAFAELLIHP
jgi:hypothetical protein